MIDLAKHLQERMSGGPQRVLHLLLGVDMELSHESWSSRSVAVRRASEDEIAAFKLALGCYAQGWLVPFEYSGEKVVLDDGRARVRPRPLPTNERLYFVCESLDGGRGAQEFMLASCLTPWELRSVFVIYCGSQVGWGEAPALRSADYRSGCVDRLLYDDRKLAEIAAVRDLLFSSDASHRLRLRSLVRRYEVLRFLADDQMAILGFFGLIEAVLTHKPDAKDPTSSLTRQIKSKLLLANRRAKHGVDFSQFSLDPRKVVGIAYEIRSLFAHGDACNFQGQYSIFCSPEFMRKFVASAARMVLRSLLEEPELVDDLRLC